MDRAPKCLKETSLLEASCCNGKTNTFQRLFTWALDRYMGEVKKKRNQAILSHVLEFELVYMHVVSSCRTKTLLALNDSLGLCWHSLFFFYTFIYEEMLLHVICQCLVLKVCQRCCRHTRGRVKEPVLQAGDPGLSRAFLIFRSEILWKVIYKWLYSEVAPHGGHFSIKAWISEQ